MKKKLIDQCDICQDKIPLFKPFYTVKSTSWCIGIKRRNDVVVLCPDCFRAYETFLDDRKAMFIYQRAKQI